MKWMSLFLRDQIMLRTLIHKPTGNMEINLFCESRDGKLLWFSYLSIGFPSHKAFNLEHIEGNDLGEQLCWLMQKWEQLGLQSWAAETQAAAVEIGASGTTAVNAHTLDLLFAYHRLLANLETHPNIGGIPTAESHLAHAKLRGLLKEKSMGISRALTGLEILITR